MTTLQVSPPGRVSPAPPITVWSGPAGLHLVRPPDAPVSLVGGPLTPDLENRAVQPLVEVLVVGQGRRSANLRNSATAVGARLRPVELTDREVAGARVLEVLQRDPETGLTVRTVLHLDADRAGLRAWTTVVNDGETPVQLQALTSLAVSSPLGVRAAEEIVSVEGHGEWLGESRWDVVGLSGQDGLVHLDLPAHQHQDARGARSVVGHGSWSTGERVPCGVLASTGGDAALAWQIEHNGAWRAEIGARLGRDDSVVQTLLLLGPTDADHAWSRTLAPGDSFHSVPVSVAAVAGTWGDAAQALARHRRSARVAPASATAVVFNDYMNTVMGDPTTDKLLPLVEAAGAVGAEVFCIDAGWYDDGGDWWDSVGAWEPSRTRFPDDGFERVLDRIRACGMTPGLWLEPEVVGVRSPVAALLPDDAFLQRGGRRIVEHDRYLLDLRHPAARRHLDEVVDRLVVGYGVGYFKLDYNVTPGPGTDRAADSVGDGLLQQNRAHLDWLEGVLARHPGLLVENCASGAMRADFSLLSRLELQSTSDQQNPLLYPPIAAGALVSILPEQAANWAYPQPDMTDEQIVFTLCTGLSGRLYLSGHLDQMSDHQRAVVAEAVTVFTSWRERLRRSVPAWPLGLPRWGDAWVASALDAGDEVLVSVWFRGGPDQEVVLDLPEGDVEIIFPRREPGPAWRVEREPDGGVRVRSGSGDTPSARTLRVVRRPI